MAVELITNSVYFKNPSNEKWAPINIIGEKMTFDAEAYGKGTRNTVPVVSGDPAYHNNALWYAQQAANSATAAAASAAVFNIEVDANHGLNFTTQS